ncbi:MAG TPA: DUF1704 domain-containing protein [Candidatus Woesebacteria bacterium]|nr:DUF1704 domain-containing protein [Candidatus Woesebacteria bacterium]
MSLIQDLTPINLAEEKQKFFDSNCQYNPQFQYRKLITVNLLYQYGKAKPNYLEYAKSIVEKAFFNRTEAEIRQMEGKKVNRRKAQTLIRDYLKTNHLEDEVEVKWIDNYISKASSFKNLLKLRTELDFEENAFKAILNHEIGTHILRRVNYVQQPFYNQKKKLGFDEYLVTEEGLASLNSLLAKSFKLDYYHALTYVMQAYSQDHSFVETYHYLLKYLVDPERTWNMTAKLKRGIYNTAEGGGFTKSYIYLEGMIRVWQYFNKTGFNIIDLYRGKIDVDDVEKAKSLNPNFIPQLPHFYSNNPHNYCDQMIEIAKINSLDQVAKI